MNDWMSGHLEGVRVERERCAGLIDMVADHIIATPFSEEVKEAERCLAQILKIVAHAVRSGDDNGNNN